MDDISEPEDNSMPMQMDQRRAKKVKTKRSRGDQGDDGALSNEYSHLSVSERTVQMKREELIEKYQDP